MNDTGKMSALLATLRKQTNGAVSGSMHEKGMDWPLNYGVSVTAIRAAAQEYAPDHEFARLLYRQEVRELRLAGIIIADPRSVTPQEATFWADGIINGEVAEHISFLLARSPYLPDIAGLWLTLDNELTSYAALLALSRRIIAERSAEWLDVPQLSEKLKGLTQLTGRSVWRAAATLIGNLYRYSPSERAAIAALAQETACGLQPPAADYFTEELFLDAYEWES